MKITPGKINTFLLLKLPAAYFCGVRVKAITDLSCIATVKHKWINQNPFKSLYFAVQAMASELSTGALVMKKIKEQPEEISMLVTQNTGSYFKKAKGRIKFECNDGLLIQETIKQAIVSKEGQKMTLTSIGIDEEGDEVGRFTYEWSIKVK